MKKEEKKNNASITIVNQYLRDLSFENPNKIEDKNDLTVNINVNVSVGKRKDKKDLYESALQIRVISKKGEQVAFIIDVDYVADVNVVCEDENIIKNILTTEIPRLLFPYARQIISNISVQGGFSALNLAPINFNSLKK